MKVILSEVTNNGTFEDFERDFGIFTGIFMRFVNLLGANHIWDPYDANIFK